MADYEQARQTIFVVDDEEAITTTLAIILRRKGFEVHPFFSAQAAVSALPQLQPDLLLSDVMMPGMNGIQLAIHVRSVLPHCRVLLFSGQAATNDLLDEAKAAGHDFELIEKPIHPSDLLVKVNAELALGWTGYLQ